MEKHWIEYREDELRIKTGLTEYDEIEYPEFDMDGCHFHPEISEDEELRQYDRLASQSKRLYYISEKFMWDHQFDL